MGRKFEAFATSRSDGSVADALLPSAGSSGIEFPCFFGTMGALRLPAILPAALRFLRLAVPSRAPVFVPPAGSDADPGAWGFLETGNPGPLLDDTETTGPPRFLENPHVHMPCSLTPVGLTHLAHDDASARPPYHHTTRAPDEWAFGAQSHGLCTRCLRFAGRITPPPRKTRFRLLATLYRTGLATRRVPTKGFR